MAILDIKELKAVSNVDFYPQHYMTGALADDAKTGDYSGKAIKSKRTDLERQIEEARESKDPESWDQLNKAWMTLFDFFKHPNVNDGELRFDIQNKECVIQVEKLIELKGDAQLAIVSAAAIDSEGGGWGSCSVRQGDKTSSMNWDAVLTGVFNSDHCDVDWVVLFQGDRFYLFEKSKWQEIPGSHLEVNGTDLLAVNADESYRVVESLFHARSFPIDSSDSFHSQVAQNAHKKAAEVTKALRETVRESVELIANEVLKHHAHTPLADLKRFNFKNDADRQGAAKVVFDQSLRYIYRILFMLFTESQDQRKGALPVHSRAYQLGYAMEKLRELEGVSLLGSGGAVGTFIQQTLERTFGIYFGGYRSGKEKYTDKKTGKTENKTDKLGFSFPAIGTSLFNPDLTPLLQQAKLTDGCMQQVIKSLSLAKVGSGRKTRTFRVHYANLGINQLGAVYEGLLSLKPEILGERVALLERKNEQAYRFVPYEKMKSLKGAKYEMDDAKNVVTRDSGEFMLTPVGLERKFSASFYTPEVLTRFLVKESVDSLLGETPSLEKMENLKICEPAMGSGAFLNGVVDEIAPRMAKFYQEADENLRQVFLDGCKSEGRKPSKAETPIVHERHHYTSRAKEHMMTHCVFGVDLNATAVELAKISLWLNCLHEDGNLPFLDFKLKHGNSLVGCWIQRHQLADGIKHFLLPHPEAIEPHLSGKVLGKTLFIEDKDELQKYKDLKKEWANASKDKSLRVRLEALSVRVDELYAQHLEIRKAKRLELVEAASAQEKSEIFERYVKEDTPYNQLRSMMDYWCSLWFWDHALIGELPTPTDYITAMEWMTETPLVYGGLEREQQLDESGFVELKTARRIALRQSFFHWDLEYAEIFVSGGFDLVLGNPPWAKVLWAEEDFFEMVRPGTHAVKMDSKKKHAKYYDIFRQASGLSEPYKQSKLNTMGFINYLGESDTYQFEDKSQTNTYKFFYQRFWQVCKKDGIQGMIAQDGILTDSGNLQMRKRKYNELEKLFRFHNQLGIFDVDAKVKFAAWVSRKDKNSISFQQIANLYSVPTVAACRDANTEDDYRGMKDDRGHFETRGHPLRIVAIDKKNLQTFAKADGSSDYSTASLPIIHGSVELEILEKFANHPIKLGDVDFFFTRKFDETEATKAGLITRSPGKSKSLRNAVMTGPNIFVGTPANKQPNPGCKSQNDFSKIDLEEVPNNFFPDTVFQCTDLGLESNTNNVKTTWGGRSIDRYRVAGRGLNVNTTGIRTLSSAVIPPEVSHTYRLFSFLLKSERETMIAGSLFHSLFFDYLVRSTCDSITNSTPKKWPWVTVNQMASILIDCLLVRSLRLSCISDHYSVLWGNLFKAEFKELYIDSNFKPEMSYNELRKKWVRNSCIRNWRQREQALCEIDAIVAHLFDFKKETMLNLYRSQFGVLQKELQDLPGQTKIDEVKHFPRYKQMEEAYDQVELFLAKSKGQIQSDAKSKKKIA